VATVNVLPSTRFLVSQGRLETVRIVSQDPIFSPSSKEYILENQSNETINYSVVSEVDWISLSSTSGSLAAGATTIVTVNLNANALALGASYYLTPIVFSDTTHGISARRYADVKVFGDVSALQVTPSTRAEVIEVSTVNGKNQSHSLTLSNSGVDTIFYSVE
jgi:hypothetical protein